jgi:anti-repressor protein
MAKSKNLKDGLLTKKELKLYSLDDNEINTILEYQEKLPILQQDNNSWINSRELHNQLRVGRDYSTWIKEQIEELELEDGIDYSPLKGSKKGRGGHNKIDYMLTVGAAKNIAMISGVKGGNTNHELKHLSKITRKYFIYIEKAFQHRQEWNTDRNGTIEMCKELKGAIVINKAKLLSTMPQWSEGNPFKVEFNMLNGIIIGMSAKEYKRQKGLKEYISIRNTFTEQQLEWVEELEHFDADLIIVQGIYDYIKRKEILTKKFELMMKKSA